MRHPSDEGWWYEVHEVGLNYRLPDVLAALGTSQLDRLEAFSRRRREIHARYTAGLADLDAAASSRPPATGRSRRGTCTRCGSATAVAGRCSTTCGRTGSGSR